MAKKIVNRGKKFTVYHDDADPANKFTAVIGVSDQHYQDEFGIWQPINEDFKADSGDFAYQSKRMRHKIEIAKSGNRRWYPRRNVTTEYVDILGMQYYTNRWRSLSLPTPVWQKNFVEWDMADLYASIRNNWEKSKTNFILKTAKAPTGLRYQVSIVGMTYDPVTGNLTSNSENIVVGRIDNPTALDANNIPVPVESTYDGTYIQWMVNTAGATYPIDVDPTFTSQPNATDGIDNYTWSTNEDYNWGGSPEISLNSITQTVGLIKFDLSSLVGTTITAAELNLFHYDSLWIDWGDIYAFRILSANSGWGEGSQWGNYANAGDSNWGYCIANTKRWAGDTGSNGGADAGCTVSGVDYSSTQMGICPIGGANKNVGDLETITMDTSEFTAMVSGNYGIAMYTSGGDATGKRYCSSDNDTPSYRPQLVVTYTASTPSSKIYRVSGVPIASVGKASGVLSASINKIAGVSNK